MAKNEKQWSTATPGLLIILIDQSGSMLSPYEGETRTVFAVRAINRVIDEIIQKNFNGDKPKNRCFISVIGYNHNVKELCSGWLADLDESPIRIETVKQKISDGAGGLVTIDKKMPIWVEPIKDDGATNMKGAFELAKDLCEKWISDKPNNPAPVIINISDGIPYYKGLDVDVCMKETQEVAQAIMNLSNEDGNVLIFNAEIGNDGAAKVVFPASKAELNNSGEGADFLYNITSEVPDGYKDAAEKNGFKVKAGTRGCVFHADAETLIGLIDFGSSKGQKDK